MPNPAGVVRRRPTRCVVMPVRHRHRFHRLAGCQGQRALGSFAVPDVVQTVVAREGGQHNRHNQHNQHDRTTQLTHTTDTQDTTNTTNITDARPGLFGIAVLLRLGTQEDRKVRAGPCVLSG